MTDRETEIESADAQGTPAKPKDELIDFSSPKFRPFIPAIVDIVIMVMLCTKIIGFLAENDNWFNLLDVAEGKAATDVQLLLACLVPRFGESASTVMNVMLYGAIILWAVAAIAVIVDFLVHVVKRSYSSRICALIATAASLVMTVLLFVMKHLVIGDAVSPAFTLGVSPSAICAVVFCLVLYAMCGGGTDKSVESILDWSDEQREEGE